MSSISGISNSYANYATMKSGMMDARRPDPAKMAKELFSKLDSSGKGYIEKSDLQTAIDKVSTSTTSSSDSSSVVDSLFSKLDGDNNSKVTQQEFSAGLEKLARQYNKQGMQGPKGMDGMPPPPPPPPPPKNDSTNTDKSSNGSSLISKIAANFDRADTNGDSKVSLEEAMAYQQTSQSSTAKNTGKIGSSDRSENNQTKDINTMLMSQIKKLMSTYEIGKESNASTGMLSAVA